MRTGVSSLRFLSIKCLFYLCFFSYFVHFQNCLSFRISRGFWNMRLCLYVECYTTLKKQLSTHLHDFISDWQLVTLSEQVTVEATNSSPQPLRGEATVSSKSVLGKFEFQKFLQWNIGCLDLHYRVERSWHVLPIEEKRIKHYPKSTGLHLTTVTREIAITERVGGGFAFFFIGCVMCLVTSKRKFFVTWCSPHKCVKPHTEMYSDMCKRHCCPETQRPTWYTGKCHFKLSLSASAFTNSRYFKCAKEDHTIGFCRTCRCI